MADDVGAGEGTEIAAGASRRAKRGSEMTHSWTPAVSHHRVFHLLAYLCSVELELECSTVCIIFLWLTGIEKEWLDNGPRQFLQKISDPLPTH